MTESPSKLLTPEEFLDRAFKKAEEFFNPEPQQKEASNTTGGTWEEPSETVILDPFLKATEVLNKLEDLADNHPDLDQKASLLISVAHGHTEIGKQLLDAFER